MKINRIYISNYKDDVRFLRPSVASIRTWYPDIPITIIQDFHGGGYSLAEECAAWNVEVYDTPVKRFGSGWGRLEPLFHTYPERFLYLDCDIVFTGPVLDELEKHEEDIVVTAKETRPDQIGRYWFDLDKLAAFDPDFRFSGSVFNTGLFVANAGVLRRDDFVSILEFSQPRLLFDSDIFLINDGGPLNYLWIKKHQAGTLSIGVSDIMPFCPSTRTPEISLEAVVKGHVPPYALHWAGVSKSRPFYTLYNGHVLQYFEDLYYTRVPGGSTKQAMRKFIFQAARIPRRLRRKLGRATK